MGISVLSPTRECELKGSMVYLLIVKYEPIDLKKKKIQPHTLDWTTLSWHLGGCFETFLEGSVDHTIYRDYAVSWSVIYFPRSGLCLYTNTSGVGSILHKQNEPNSSEI